MSAYIVNDKLISDTLNFIKIHLNQSYGLTEAIPSYYTNQVLYNKLDSNNEKLNFIGQELLNYNYKSVNNRYPDNQDIPHDFKFKPHYEAISIAQYLKNLDCIEYQCCEPDDFNQSEIYKLINCMIKFGYRRVDGYKQAKWGY